MLENPFRTRENPIELPIIAWEAATGASNRVAKISQNAMAKKEIKEKVKGNSKNNGKQI